MNGSEKPLEVAGVHHLTAITAAVSENYRFYTQTLGMRLVKKTVNQDDVSAYHLFYADGVGSPGTDLTFFDWRLKPERRGSRSIVRTGLRISGDAALEYWERRLRDAKLNVSSPRNENGTSLLEFNDPEGQRLALVVDRTAQTVRPWSQSPVPSEHQIIGLGPITLSVPEIATTERVLTEVLNMRKSGEYRRPATDGSGGECSVTVYSMNQHGPAGELHVAEEPGLESARSGAGGAHHVAFRVPTFDEYDRWNLRLQELRVRSSGPVDRFYFRSLYFREPNGILFELATDGPGFHADESIEHLGERLSLPPFLEAQRREIEAGLRPL